MIGVVKLSKILYYEEEYFATWKNMNDAKGIIQVIENGIWGYRQKLSLDNLKANKRT